MPLWVPSLPRFARRSPATPPLRDAASGEGKRRRESHPERMRKRARIRGPLPGERSPLSSVVLFGEVQRSQASETEAAALRVKAVHLSVLTLKQVLDPLCALLLQRRQLLFNLSGGGDTNTSGSS